MSLRLQRLIQIDLHYTEPRQSIPIDLEGYPPSRLVALRVAGRAAAAGYSLDLYTYLTVGTRDHLVALTGEVTLTSTVWTVEMLPDARPMRRSDILHIIPIWCPTLTPDTQLTVYNLGSPSEVWLNTVTALLEPING